jgi:hypothetical protein
MANDGIERSKSYKSCSESKGNKITGLLHPCRIIPSLAGSSLHLDLFGFHNLNKVSARNLVRKVEKVRFHELRKMH